MKNCKECATEFGGEAQAKTGFCSGCVEAIKREKKLAFKKKKSPKKKKSSKKGK